MKSNLHPNFRDQTVKSPKEAGSVLTNWEQEEVDMIPGPALEVMLYCHDLNLLALNC